MPSSFLLRVKRGKPVVYERSSDDCHAKGSRVPPRSWAANPLRPRTIALIRRTPLNPYSSRDVPSDTFCWRYRFIRSLNGPVNRWSVWLILVQS